MDAPKSEVCIPTHEWRAINIYFDIDQILFKFYSSARNCPFKSLRLVKSLLQPLLEQLKVSPESTKIVHVKLFKICSFFRIFAYLAI
jgi:hypothetical protein